MTNLVKENFTVKKHKDRIITIIALTLLVLINVGINESFRSGFLDVIWVGDRDDPNHIGIANSFRFNKTFERSFLGDWIYRSSVDDIIKQYDDISPPHSGKGPVFYILLASFYEILNTTPDNNYYHASILNTIISSIFIILFYFLVKRHFSQKIAILSSFLVILLPLFGFLSIRAIPMLIFFLFSLSSLFFLERSKKHYIIFGLLSGLAHLSHPFGIFLPLTYIVFLLVKKEFKGSLLVFLIWVGTLLPWLIRNYFLFEDIGQGLYIPFSQYISNLFSFLPTNSITYAAIDYLPSTMLSPWPPMESLLGAFYQFDDLFHMGYFLIILIIFTGFTFFRLHRIEKQKIIFLLGSFSVIISTYLSIYFFVYNYSIQYFVIFGLPVIIVSLLFVFYRKIFDQSIKRYHTFVMLFLFVNMAGYLYSAVFLQRGIPEVRQMFLPLILVIPLVIFSIEKIFYQVKYFSKLKKHHILAAVFMTLILLPVFYESVEGITLLSSFQFHEKQTNEIKQMNRWILENLPKSSHIISNSPSTVSMNTNLKSIHLYPTDYSQENVDKIVDHFKISHLIFYDVPRYGGENVLGTLDKIPIEGEHLYKKMKNWGASYIFQVIHVEDADINYPFLYVKKAELLEREGKLEESKMILNEIRNFKPESREMQEKLCIELIYYEKLDLGLLHCNNLLSKDPNDLVAHQSLPIYYQKTGQEDKVLEIMHSYVRLFEEKSSYERVLESWSSAFSNLILLDKSYEKPLYKILDNAEKYYQTGEYSRANKLVDRISFISGLSSDLVFDTYTQKILIINKIGTYEEILATYDSLIEISYARIEEYAQNNQYSEVNKLEDSLIITLKAKAAFLENQDDFHKAFYVYNEILNINQFDVQTHKKIAVYHEKYGKLAAALHHYEFALNLEPNNDYLSMKINELKEKLNN